MRKWVFILVLIPFFSEAGNLNRIRKALEKFDMEKAKKLIDRSRNKGPNNPGLDYFSAVLYSTEPYHYYDLDSARLFIHSAAKGIDEASIKQKQDLEDNGVSVETVVKLQLEIRDRQFQDVTAGLTAFVADQFLKNYPDSPYEGILTFKRDSMVYDQVVEMDSEQVYQDFLDQYAGSPFSNQAVVRLDQIRYEILQTSHELSDYYDFLRNYPGTKFGVAIESYILKKTTAGHLLDSYLDFMVFAETDSLKKCAADVLFYMDGSEQFLYRHPHYDSLQEAIRIRDISLLPTLESGRFGFYTPEGDLIIDHKYDNIDERLKCEMTADEWVMVQLDGLFVIIDKRGHIVMKDVEEYTDLGHGLAKVRKGSDWYLYHKSGFKVLPDKIEDAEVLGTTWIKVKKNGKWGLVSMFGYPVADYQHESIELMGPYWVFEKNGQLAVYTSELIRKDLNQNGLVLEFKFDDVALVDDNKLIGFREDRECMYDSGLNFLIPWGEYEIIPEASGWYLKTSDGYRLYDHSEEDILNQVHPYLTSNSGWLAIKTTKDWMLLPRTTLVQPSRGFDSLALINDFCVYAKKDHKEELLFGNNRRIRLSDHQQVIRVAHQPNYLIVSNKIKKTLIDKEGQALVKGDFDELSFFTDSLIKVEVNDKQGLMDLTGTYLIDPIYDALDEQNGLILCLKRGKIGCYDLRNDLRISPKYESRIQRLGQNYLVKNKGKYGVLDAEGGQIISNNYDEIQFWNDTSLLVREAGEWRFINHREEQIGETLESPSLMVFTDEGSFWKYVKDGRYGLLSNKNGVLLTPEFTDVFNIGTMHSPLFFADQNLSKAGFHVVSYIDRSGKLLLSEAYRKEEFDKILCED